MTSKIAGAIRATHAAGSGMWPVGGGVGEPTTRRCRAGGGVAGIPPGRCHSRGSCCWVERTGARPEWTILSWGSTAVVPLSEAMRVLGRALVGAGVAMVAPVVRGLHKECSPYGIYGVYRAFTCVCIRQHELDPVNVLSTGAICAGESGYSFGRTGHSGGFRGSLRWCAGARVGPVREPRDGMGGESIRDADRFATLFADLESAAAGSQAWVDDLDARELERAEHAAIAWSDRLRAGATAEIHFYAVREESWTVSGAVERVGSDAVFMRAPSGPAGVHQRWAVSLSAIHLIAHLGQGVERAGVVDARLGLASALREWSADGVALMFVQPHRVMTGTAIRVGRDHVDIVETDARSLSSMVDECRRLTIPLRHIRAVREV